MTWEPPMLPASAGALIRDAAGRLLILKTTYKSGWSIPGGIIDDTGESPWDACRREVWEETGLRVDRGRLVAVDTRPGRPSQPDRPGRKLGLRFLFDCGTVDDEQVCGIRLQAEEISDYRFVAPEEAVQMLRPAVSRRVASVLAASGAAASPLSASGPAASGCVYLEDGQPVSGVGRD